MPAWRLIKYGTFSLPSAVWSVIFLPHGTFFRGHVYGAGCDYGKIQMVEELGPPGGAHRKQRQLTLETISDLGYLRTRFLSEFERGKEPAEIAKVLYALRTLGLEINIQPCRHVVSAHRTGKTHQKTT